MEDLRYPIGPRPDGDAIDSSMRSQWIEDIAAAPAMLRKAIAGLSPAQADTPYRVGGWTARQITHHLADSHMNAFIRFKLALTEKEPTIKPYHHDRWAETKEVFRTPLEASVGLMDSLHLRWAELLRVLDDDEWHHAFNHPEIGRVTLEWNARYYAWHGRHHVAHITSLRQRMGW